MNREELLNRGWQVWGPPEDFVEEKWDGDLVLCPESDFCNVPDGIEMLSVLGEKAVKGVDYIDMDVRDGVLAYGVIA